MNREEIDKLVYQEMIDATKIKKYANKLMNKLFPWPWWSKEKKDFASKKQEEISNLFKEEILPSEILAKLNEIENDINNFK